MGGFHLVEPPQDGSRSLMESSASIRGRDIEDGNPALNNEPTNFPPKPEPVVLRDFGTEKDGASSNYNLTS